MKVTKTDQTGDNNYYALHDVYWAVEPTDDDPGICLPKAGAVPRDKFGTPFEDEPPHYLFDE
jgi:hypothetical protein